MPFPIPQPTDIADSAAGVLQRADKALYDAKARGRNCVSGSVAEILPVSQAS